ncbi:AMP-binding protein [Mycobacterium sp. Aquia_216]|uniref:AMP-binding protein n=1 Tax=Mycobacterium sp. Aquia_216 TaxID=2991729 RepID=UPI00227A966D|nr:AMP-binding protein [Mycobacterium sp. Aquia_216]WAJ45323.1 AMP-binding protein [Mycobacterium sp. Aquia_216]
MGDSTWLSYGDVHLKSAALAGALAELGIAKNDRVAIVLPNRTEYLLAFFALGQLGAIHIPVNPYLKGDFLFHQLSDSGAKALIGDAPALDHVNGMLDRLPGLGILISVDEGSASTGSMLSFRDLLSGERRAPAVPISQSDLLAVMYTSGTTGMPKGCCLSHGYYTAMLWPWYQNGWLREGDRTLTAMPLFHIGGQGIALMPVLMAGNSIAYLEHFSASGFVQAARKTNASVVFGVGPMGMAVLATPESEADHNHSLRLGVFVPMPPDAQRQLSTRFGIEVISETYGQTECQPITSSPISRPASKLASMGKPVSALDVELHDEDGSRVPMGSVGEIVIRPRERDVMFQGYWNNPKATVEASRDLWHHTGDLARADEDGYLYFVDRKKDAMRRRGENISSAEVEAALLRHPKIAAIAVHAVPSPLGEDDVKAVIVCEAAATFEPEELHEFFRSALPYFAVPRYVDFVEALPVTPTGRVQKHVLRAKDNSAAWDFERLGLAIDKVDRRR